jgi:hypothetical protein
MKNKLLEAIKDLSEEEALELLQALKQHLRVPPDGYRFYENKFYVREDWNVERMRPDRQGAFCRDLYKIGNCFETEGEAFEAANKIRRLMGCPLVDERRHPDNRKLAESQVGIIVEHVGKP